MPKARETDTHIIPDVHKMTSLVNAVDVSRKQNRKHKYVHIMTYPITINDGVKMQSPIFKFWNFKICMRFFSRCLTNYVPKIS